MTKAEVDQRLKFYGVDTLEALVEALARHVDRLDQAAQGAVSRMQEAMEERDAAMSNPVEQRIEFDLDAVQRLIGVFGGEEGFVTVAQLESGHSGPGLYAWFSEYPEEGSFRLFEVESDDD